MRSDKQYAPRASTPKPYIRGPQTAEVVGDGEIDCDKYGRILVRFHWDRKTDQSRRVRVAQVAAGKSWGAIFTPRIGMEVMVDFLEGDPDQPIITGCVYNGENMPPFGLPGSKNISGWKIEFDDGWRRLQRIRHGRLRRARNWCACMPSTISIPPSRTMNAG